MIWRCRDRTYDLSERTLVMGILNVTPDSFSDGGRYTDPKAAADRAREMAAEGADLIDLGAESTRPGSEPVSGDEQCRRLAPVLEALAGDALALSIDTRSAAVAREALAAGACIVNDVSALSDPRMAAVVAESRAGLVLMHMIGTPETMQDRPAYEDVTHEVRDRLAERLQVARRNGIEDERLAVDPGVGFGKAIRHNLELLARLSELAVLGRPILIGVSRKSFIGKILDLPLDQRIEAGLAAAAVAVFQGARIVRTHEVAATVRAVRMVDAVCGARR